MPQLPPIVYAAFAGTIDQQALGRIFAGLSRATNEGVQTIHLSFQSTGGTINDGIALYNFVRGYPLDLHIYNIGAVQSAAVLAFVAAPHRHVSAHGAFMIHKTSGPQIAATAAQLKATLASVVADDKRTEAILRAHTNIPAQKWALHKRGEAIFNAQEAVQFGIADDISEFVVPPGNQIFNV